MTNFFESVRLDLRGSGVDVTIIQPGFVRTAMTDHDEHPKPFMLELDDALERMMGAIRSRRAAHGFPLPLWALVYFGQIFPRRLYDWLGTLVVGKKS